MLEGKMKDDNDVKLLFDVYFPYSQGQLSDKLCKISYYCGIQATRQQVVNELAL